MSPIGPRDHAAIEIDPLELDITQNWSEETPQSGIGAQIAFVGAKALQIAGAVYTLGTELAKNFIPSAAIGALKPWLYYGKGVETEAEKRWAVVQEGGEAAGEVLVGEAFRIVFTGALIGASSLTGAVSRWFWEPITYSPPEKVCAFKELQNPSMESKCTLKCTLDLDSRTCEATAFPKDLGFDIDYSGPRGRDVEICYDEPMQITCKLIEREPQSRWTQSTINLISMFPAMGTLAEVSQVGVNTVASNLVKLVGDREPSPEEKITEDPAWKTKLAEVAIGLGEACMISYLAYSGAFVDFVSMDILAPLFTLAPVFLNLLEKDRMEQGGKKLLSELKEELAPLVRRLQSERLTSDEKAALMEPFKEKIKKLQELQQTEKQAEGLFPKQREWEELHDEKTNKVGAVAYQALSSVAGYFLPLMGIQSAFSTIHLLSSRAITALTGKEQLGRWALPVAITVLTALFGRTCNGVKINFFHP